jgi:hypothetical protein
MLVNMRGFYEKKTKHIYNLMNKLTAFIKFHGWMSFTMNTWRNPRIPFLSSLRDSARFGFRLLSKTTAIRRLAFHLWNLLSKEVYVYSQHTGTHVRLLITNAINFCTSVTSD